LSFYLGGPLSDAEIVLYVVGVVVMFLAYQGLCWGSDRLVEWLGAKWDASIYKKAKAAEEKDHDAR
jgi:hypothetical protein